MDPRQVGLRNHAVHWRAAGEQIDMQSGNLNCDCTPFKAEARGGWGVTFALNYNRQIWHKYEIPGQGSDAWPNRRDMGSGFWRRTWPERSRPCTRGHTRFIITSIAILPAANTGSTAGR